jgi:SAM-dependent methyltransferase
VYAGRSAGDVSAELVERLVAERGADLGAVRTGWGRRPLYRMRTMSSYALLLAPSANRVYAEAAGRVAAAELAVFANAGVLTGPLTRIDRTQIGGVGYLTFDSDLSAGDAAHLSNLSAAYALFERVGGDLLRPVALRPLRHFDDDLITIPKYAGKTNEQFTRLLVNVTVLASASAGRLLDGGLTVLDPLCGRGTTLNQALMYGYDGIGIELDGKDVDAYAAFLRTWLRRKRIKHVTDMHPVRRDKRLVARRFEAFVAGKRKVVVLHADTLHAREVLKAGCADVIVTDAPYGVAHGSRTPSGLSRRPLDLLAAAAPVWADLLRPGGALGMSWNTHVAARADAAKALAGAGLEIVEGPGYDSLAHRVDQAIHRDVLVARKA